MFGFNSKWLTVVRVIFLGALVAGCARGVQAEPEETHRGDSALDSGTDVLDGHDVRNVAVGDEFELRLDANATTGCSWQVTALDESLVELLSDEYVEGPNAEGRLGAGGQAVLRFRALAPGRTVIRLAYGHAWEMEQATYANYELDVIVQ